MDLVVDLNFRMDTSALYSDIVLPAATWYEKADLNSTDMHTFIHPLSAGGAAVLGVEERLADLQGDRRSSSRSWRPTHFPEPVRDIVASPLAHDTPAEIAQPAMRDWTRGEVRGDPRQDDAEPARRHARLRERLQPVHLVRPAGARQRARRARHALRDRRRLRRGAARRCRPVQLGRRDAIRRCSDDEHVCDVILRFATVTNGELAYRSYKNMEEKVGLPLAHLAEKHRGVRHQLHGPAGAARSGSSTARCGPA